MKFDTKIVFYSDFSKAVKYLYSPHYISGRSERLAPMEDSFTPKPS